ncbi:hypothetical protein DSAG12_03849 [Promethearchaeum syntrophicum]|uniref:Uncharacterized protein n=1 Tax=Promethearchaeum syntrophicum TaxID=2594042 RepID=A0A5B9DG64_9ARCH|nr:hypothetical protein [Candidatus Prometheoarchaeum syntrophicum]
MKKAQKCRIMLIIFSLLCVTLTSQVKVSSALSEKNKRQSFDDGAWLVKHKSSELIQITDLVVDSTNIYGFGTIHVDDSVEKSDLLLINWGPDGNLKWSKVIEFRDQQASAGKIWSDGAALYIVARFGNSGGPYSSWMAKWDFNGTQIWNRVGRGIGSEGVLNIFESNEKIIKISVGADSNYLNIETITKEGEFNSIIYIDLGDSQDFRDSWVNGTDFFLTGDLGSNATIHHYSPSGSLIDSFILPFFESSMRFIGSDTKLLVATGSDTQFDFYTLNHSGDILSHENIIMNNGETPDKCWPDAFWSNGSSFFLSGSGYDPEYSRLPTLIQFSPDMIIEKQIKIGNTMGYGITSMTGYNNSIFMTWFSADQSLNLMKIPLNSEVLMYEIKFPDLRVTLLISGITLAGITILIITLKPILQKKGKNVPT